MKTMVIRPAIFDTVEGLAAGMSTRWGGVSESPYASLNLDHRGPDDALLREENRRLFCAALGFGAGSLVGSLQVHEDQILVAEQPGLYEGYDAIVTQRKGLLLAVSIADCTPILIYDTHNKAVGAVHAGWRGTVKSIVAKTLAKMHEAFGTVGTQCLAYIGPCIEHCFFEVGEEVAAEFDPAFKTWNSERGKFFVDLKKANTAQLIAFGVPHDQIEVSPLSTVGNTDQFFSYREEKGETGRMLAAIGLR